MSNDEGYVRLALAMILDALRYARQGDKREIEWLLTEGRWLLYLMDIDVSEETILRAIETKPKRRRIWLH